MMQAVILYTIKLMTTYKYYGNTLSLTHLFNLSLLNYWMFSRRLEIGQGGPCSKSADMSKSFNNIIDQFPSSPCIVSKVLECVIYRIVFHDLRLNWPISSKQWGFLPGRSSISALLSVTHDRLHYLDQMQGHDVCSVYFDLRKAFDSIPHRPLLR